MPKAPRMTPSKPTKAAIDKPMALCREAQETIDNIRREWQLTPPVAALLQLVGEAVTKAAECEAVTKREGMFIGDAKGAAKPHPAALLARDYRAQASTGLQRLLAHLEGR